MTNEEKIAQLLTHDDVMNRKLAHELIKSQNVDLETTIRYCFKYGKRSWANGFTCEVKFHGIRYYAACHDGNDDTLVYNIDHHFDIYHRKTFKQSIDDYINILKKNNKL